MHTLWRSACTRQLSSEVPAKNHFQYIQIWFTKTKYRRQYCCVGAGKKSGNTPGESSCSGKYSCTINSYKFAPTSSIFSHTFPSPCPTFKCFYSSFSSSLGSVCSHILDDKCSQSRKRQHHEHHRRVAEDNDTVCGHVAENHTEGSGSPSGRKLICKVRQTV